LFPPFCFLFVIVFGKFVGFEKEVADVPHKHGRRALRFSYFFCGFIRFPFLLVSPFSIGFSRSKIDIVKEKL